MPGVNIDLIDHALEPSPQIMQSFGWFGGSRFRVWLGYIWLGYKILECRNPALQIRTTGIEPL